jgi:hypothetical protein
VSHITASVLVGHARLMRAVRVIDCSDLRESTPAARCADRLPCQCEMGRCCCCCCDVLALLLVLTTQCRCSMLSTVWSWPHRRRVQRALEHRRGARWDSPACSRDDRRSADAHAQAPVGSEGP